MYTAVLQEVNASQTLCGSSEFIRDRFMPRDLRMHSGTTIINCFKYQRYYDDSLINRVLRSNDHRSLSGGEPRHGKKRPITYASSVP